MAAHFGDWLWSSVFVGLDVGMQMEADIVTIVDGLSEREAKVDRDKT